MTKSLYKKKRYKRNHIYLLSAYHWTVFRYDQEHYHVEPFDFMSAVLIVLSADRDLNWSVAVSSDQCWPSFSLLAARDKLHHADSTKRNVFYPNLFAFVVDIDGWPWWTNLRFCATRGQIHFSFMLMIRCRVSLFTFFLRIISEIFLNLSNFS